MRRIYCTTTATSADDALARVGRFIGPDATDRLEGFSLTGRARARSAKHLLWEVEVAHEGGDVNRAWVTLTSYGISPAGLGSVWEAMDR